MNTRESALNSKLAKWAGFKLESHKTLARAWGEGGGELFTLTYWTAPQDDEMMELPDFTTSLDACFKWLVPKIRELGYRFNLNSLQGGGFIVRIYEKPFDFKFAAEGKTASLALCLAIEVLLDGDTR